MTTRQPTEENWKDAMAVIHHRVRRKVPKGSVDDVVGRVFVELVAFVRSDHEVVSLAGLAASMVRAHVRRFWRSHTKERDLRLDLTNRNAPQATEEGQTMESASFGNVKDSDSAASIVFDVTKLRGSTDRLVAKAVVENRDLDVVAKESGILLKRLRQQARELAERIQRWRKEWPGHPGLKNRGGNPHR